MKPTVYREHCVGTLCPFYKFETYEAESGAPMMKAICTISPTILFDMVDRGHFIEALLLQTQCVHPTEYRNQTSGL